MLFADLLSLHLVTLCMFFIFVEILNTMGLLLLAKELVVSANRVLTKYS